MFRAAASIFLSFPHLDWGSIPDWIAALAAVITTAIAAYLGFITFGQQRTSGDIQLALGLFATINLYWDRIVDSDSKNYKYDMGQILAHFELASSLFNNSSLSAKALPILKDRIIEVFTAVQSPDEGNRLMESCQSAPDTFKELRILAKSHMLNAIALLDDCVGTIELEQYPLDRYEE